MVHVDTKFHQPECNSSKSYRVHKTQMDAIRSVATARTVNIRNMSFVPNLIKIRQTVSCLNPICHLRGGHLLVFFCIVCITSWSDKLQTDIDMRAQSAFLAPSIVGVLLMDN